VSPLLSDIAAVLAPSLVITVIGFLWGRSTHAFDQDFVTRLVTNVGAPCLVFSALTKTPLPGGEVVAMGGATFVCLVVFAVVGSAALIATRLSVRTYLPSILFPNIGNMGLPICLFAFGERGLTLATVYFASVSVWQFTAGPAIAAGRLDLGFLLRVPFIYAVAAALAVGGLGLSMPQWLTNTASLAGGLTIPLMLLALGVALARLEARSLPRATALSVLRIVLGAATGFGVAHLFGFTGAERGVLVIQSAMPTAVFNYLFANLFRTDPEGIAGVVLISTVLSYLTLPFLVAMVM
jgi:predicted permease